MKSNPKKRKVQYDYRKKVEQNKNIRKHTLEAIIVISIIIIILFLNGVFKGF